MLSRTADSLFWCARYIERADSTARLLIVGNRLALIPNLSANLTNEWNSLLETVHAVELFNSLYDEVNQQNIERFLVFDKRNPSSIRSCLRAARNNAREIRNTLTEDVWYAINQAFLDFKEFDQNPDLQASQDIVALCDWVKSQSATVRGAFINTQLDSDSGDFFNLGYYIERGANTARILDIKYQLLLPHTDMVGGTVDLYQWSSLLQALSSERSFKTLYNTTSVDNIIDHLVLNASCPRSLHHCCLHIHRYLLSLSEHYAKPSRALGFAASILADIHSTLTDDVFRFGLHEFLMGYIADNNRLAQEIANSFNFEAL